ncbi:15003_t:CDS:2, partial [Cetraspora pellucida]
KQSSNDKIDTIVGYSIIVTREAGDVIVNLKMGILNSKHILINNGEMMLSDFGISKLLNQAEISTN